MSPGRPPRLGETLLRLFLPADYREHAIGDLEEERGVLEARVGPARANRWYWGQVIRSILLALRRRARSPGAALSDVSQEIRLAARSLRRRPSLVIASVATLTLGIGATTAIFSVTDAVLFTPLPYPDGDR